MKTQVLYKIWTESLKYGHREDSYIQNKEAYGMFIKIINKKAL
jgi:hypothetical protein